jgi:hypothetical protein
MELYETQADNINYLFRTDQHSITDRNAMDAPHYG